MNGVARRAFESLAQLQCERRLLQFCYSVKTNPRVEMLQAALDNGIRPEVISPAELEHAARFGAPLPAIVYNGPYPAAFCGAQPGIVFADSVQAFTQNAQRFAGALCGVRVRPPQIASRFGVPHEDLVQLARAIRESGRASFGVSFHVRPEDYGRYTWRALAQSVISIAQDLERASGSRVAAFDCGGGKEPRTFDASVRAGDFEWLEDAVSGSLASVKLVLAEPGQALAAAVEAQIAPILEVRENDIVIDAGYPDVPQIRTFEHRLFLMRNGRIEPVRAGAGRILGRTCLEYDVVASNVDLSGCEAGAAVVIADCGAYDASMAFDFSQGVRSSGNSVQHGGPLR
ncbi:MAG: hypothetical protein ABR508_10495 [Candidatus Baltobacteraceae bacterium]